MLTRQDIYDAMHGDAVQWVVTADVPGAMVWQRPLPGGDGRTVVLVFTGGPDGWTVTVEFAAGAGWVAGDPIDVASADRLERLLGTVATRPSWRTTRPTGAPADGGRPRLGRDHRARLVPRGRVAHRSALEEAAAAAALIHRKPDVLVRERMPHDEP